MTVNSYSESFNGKYTVSRNIYCILTIHCIEKLCNRMGAPKKDKIQSFFLLIEFLVLFINYEKMMSVNRPLLDNLLQLTRSRKLSMTVL